MGRWVQRDAQTWWAIVQRQVESGLSQVAFCAAEGLSIRSLQNWKRKFIREGRISAGATGAGRPLLRGTRRARGWGRAGADRRPSAASLADRTGTNPPGIYADRGGDNPIVKIRK